MATLYRVEILGGNAIGNRVRVARTGAMVYANTSGRMGGTLCAGEWEADAPPTVALFADEHTASEVAVAALWNGQRYAVRAARGREKARGAIIDVQPGDVLHSASSDDPVTVSRPAHRPRRDPVAARVNLVVRVHPHTRLRLAAEAQRTGESQGQIVDRAAEHLDILADRSAWLMLGRAFGEAGEVLPDAICRVGGAIKAAAEDGHRIGRMAIEIGIGRLGDAAPVLPVNPACPVR